MDHPALVAEAATEAEAAVADPGDRVARVARAIGVVAARVSAAEAVVPGVNGRRSEKIPGSKSA